MKLSDIVMDTESHLMQIEGWFDQFQIKAAREKHAGKDCVNVDDLLLVVATSIPLTFRAILIHQHLFLLRTLDYAFYLHLLEELAEDEGYTILTEGPMGPALAEAVREAGRRTAA